MKKLLAPIVVVLLALAPVACGGGDEETSAFSDEIQAKIDQYLAGPKIVPPDRPPPKELVVKDIKVGSGPAAKKGDRVTLHYIAVAWVSKEQFSRRWEPDPPVVYPRLGYGSFTGIEKAIEGVKGVEPMREGGRREIVVPNYSQLPAVIFVVDLEKVEPGTKKKS